MRVSLASESGRADGRNEDWAGATDRVAIVLDGLSEGAETGCIHGTPWFVHQLGTRLLAHAGDISRTLDIALSDAIREVADSHADTCDLNHPGSPCTTVALLRENGSELEYLVLSDSMIVFDAHPEPLIISDRSVETVAKDEVSAAHAVPMGHHEHFQLYQKMIAAQQKVRNTPQGYWVAQANPTAAQYAQQGSVPAGDSATALVLSDGAARAVTDFQVHSWTDLIRTGRQSGPACVIGMTRQLESEDPDGQRWPRYKVADDASVIVCQLE